MYRKMVPVFVVVCVFGFSVCAVVLAAAAIDMSAEEQIKTGKGLIGKALQFLREVRVELKKVTWPSRKQAIGSTVVVLILVRNY